MEKKILLIAVVVIAAWSGANAQVQEWDTDGNAAFWVRPIICRYLSLRIMWSGCGYLKMVM